MNEAGVDKATLLQASFAYEYDNSHAIDAALAHPERFTEVGDRVGDISSTTQAMDRYREVKVAFKHSWEHEVGAPPAFSVREPLFALAKNPNVYIKTAINNIAAAREGSGKPEPLYAKLVDVFGARPIMWSSNYPAHPKFGRVKTRLNESKKVLAFLSAENQTWTLGKSALAFYPALQSSLKPSRDDRRVMRMPPARRSAVAALAFLLAATPSLAQQWKPTRHVELISASGVGSASDGVLRLVERTLQEKKLIDATSTVINKPGGGGNVGWMYTNQQPADGHHLTIIIGNLISNQIIGSSPLAYTDLTCVAQLFSEYTAVGVRTDSPIKDAKDLMARLKADSGSLSVAVGTAFGGSGHIALALAAKDAGGEPKRLKAVVFPGFSQSVAALYGGHIDLAANPHSSFLGPLREGRIRVLAVTAPQRLPGDFANVPTWKELGVDADIEAFRAIAGPKGLGAPQVAYWEARLRAMAATEEWKQALEKRAWVNRYAGPEGCAAGLKRQYAQMRRGLAELGLAKD